MYEYDNAYVYIVLAAAQEFAGLGQRRHRSRGAHDGPLGGARRSRAASATRSASRIRTVDWQEQNTRSFRRSSSRSSGWA